MSTLLSPISFRNVTLKNRVVVSPMCQYSAVHGLANDWHFAHLARFAIGGFGLVIVEATAVSPEGRITYGDLGLWSDEQIAPLARIAAFLKSQGAAAGIQIGHAGRKASAIVPWRGGFNETEAEKPEIGFEEWEPIAPSPILHSAGGLGHKTPREMTLAEIEAMPGLFAAATRRAHAAGFDLVEMHSAHGYLMNEFLSPVANKREDDYGGSLENRMRLPLMVARAIREAWPDDKPLFARLSVTDHIEGGWTVADSVILAGRLKALGVDAIDCSSTGFEGAKFAVGPAFQLPLAEAIRAEVDMPVMAVGLITSPELAEEALTTGKADLIALGRTALDDPNWPQHARHALGGSDDPYALYPKQVAYAVRGRDRALGLRGFEPKG